MKFKTKVNQFNPKFKLWPDRWFFFKLINICRMCLAGGQICLNHFQFSPFQAILRTNHQLRLGQCLNFRTFFLLLPWLSLQAKLDLKLGLSLAISFALCYLGSAGVIDLDYNNAMPLPSMVILHCQILYSEEMWLYWRCWLVQINVLQPKVFSKDFLAAQVPNKQTLLEAETRLHVGLV